MSTGSLGTPKGLHRLNHKEYKKIHKEYSSLGTPKGLHKLNHKDTDRITETLLLCYIFGILMTQAFEV